MAFSDPILFSPVLMNRSFALRAFNIYETEINRHYWAYKVIGDFAGHIARRENKENPDKATADLFHASGRDAPRIPPTVGEWVSAQGDMENWMRLGALVSALSYLEIYLKQVINSALLADPLRVHGMPGLVEGAYVLKTFGLREFGDTLRECTTGDWEARANKFRNLFGHTPRSIERQISDFESMRKLRNNFAHGFGRMTDTPNPITVSPSDADRLSQENLKKYLAAISRVAKEYDEILKTTIIGNFELVYFYHNLRNTTPAVEDRDRNRSDRFKRVLNREVGVAISKKNARLISEYYESI